MTIIKTQKTQEQEIKKIPKELEKIGQDQLDLKELIDTSSEDFGQYWVKLLNKKGSLQGKLSFKDALSRKLVIYVPGFPGDGATSFEQTYLDTLVKNKYTVFTLRHNGTVINTKLSFKYINCVKKQTKARFAKEKILGDRDDYTLNDWLKEPYLALGVLAEHFEDIYLIGHSLGGLCSIYSLLDFSLTHGNLIHKVTRLVSLAGTTGIIRSKQSQILKRWQELLNFEIYQKAVQVGDSTKNLAYLKQAYQRIHKKSAQYLPKSLEFLMLCAWGDSEGTIDEYINPVENLELIGNLGRGCLKLVKKAKPVSPEEMAHDFNFLDPQTILNMLTLDLEQENQIGALYC
ncbi:MAG: alpha/beta fold hydrolase [Candidatus Moranbacteria bacterium]|nr:alpha/beta fold hydrolase [Candidatus Moranbacteria bacterium]